MSAVTGTWFRSDALCVMVSTRCVSNAINSLTLFSLLISPIHLTEVTSLG